MRHVRWLDSGAPDDLNRPVVLIGFQGWSDAGEAASTALVTLIETSEARLIAEIDPEMFTDFASVRPTVRIGDEGQRHIDWPTVQVYAAKMPGADALFIVGPEPSLRWREFSNELVDLCERVGTELVIPLGALLAEVPHTRPTQIIGTSMDDTLIERFGLGRSRYEGPTGIVGVFTTELAERGIPAASLWAAVASYTAQVPSPNAARALVERACEMMGTPAPTMELDAQVDQFNEHIAELVADDDDLGIYVARLESMADEYDDSDETPSRDIDESDAATIAAEVEQFLRDRPVD